MKKITLEKRNAEISRSYAGGKEQDTVNRIDCGILREGAEIGTCTIHQSSVNINIYDTGEQSIESNFALVETMFNSLNE